MSGATKQNSLIMTTNPQIIVLTHLLSLFDNISPKLYNTKSAIISNGTIGEHVRHIVEFYQCCLFSSKDGVINYTLRVRNKDLETSIEKGKDEVKKIVTELQHTLHEKDIPVRLCSSLSDPNEIGVLSSKKRELIYCMDHCIHHQFIIKTALAEFKHDHILPSNFGVAFSTQEHRNQCA